MVGTGVFVSLALALGIAGNALPTAILLAAGVAFLNGLSSASLARSHPVSGGTYEYGYHYLDGRVGFLAGWLFLCAKSASAAAAARTLAAALAPGNTPSSHAVIAAGVIVAVTLLVLRGLRLSTPVVVALVTTTIAGLGYLVIGVALSDTAAWAPVWLETGVRGGDQSPLRATLAATALIFVAYTGYGRIATLGEEILEPRRNIPRALLAAIGVALVVYLLVAMALLKTNQPAALSDAARGTGEALFVAAESVGLSAARPILGVAVAASLLSVLLNLVLGLSRVLLAMARRGDMPTAMARLNKTRTAPPNATIFAGLLVFWMLFLGNLYATWSFSAVTVLLYYGTTHLAATRLPPTERLGGRWVAPVGALACAALALQVDPTELLRAGAAIVLGGVWYLLCSRRRSSMRRDAQSQ